MILYPALLTTESNAEEINRADFWIKKSQKSALSQDVEWKSLLHYKQSSSIITDDFFFLEKDGKNNPQLELEKTISEFFRTDKSDNTHAICRYPARLKWISQKLINIKNYLPNPNCSELRSYLQNTSAEEIHMVFASENVNSLISMMGHSFLKITGHVKHKKVTHALGYFANFDTNNPISSVFNALFSGTSGVYLLEPYNKKIIEYNDNEKRNIWEYKINFTPEQINTLMLHIWEMKQVNVKYNFVTHNCGSALLYLLYVVDPNLRDSYSYLDAPIDIIKNIDRKGYIGGIELSPADSYRFRMLSSQISQADRTKILSFLTNGDVKNFDHYSSQNKANIFEATRIVTNYKLVNKDIGQEKYENLINSINQESEKLPSPNTPLKIKNPLQKSDSSRISLGYKNQGYNKDYLNFSFYPIYNSINDNNSEYFNEFELQIANIEGGYYTQNNRTRIDNIDLVKMKNIIPYDSLVDGISGSFRTNIERERFDSESNKMFPNISFGAGLGKNIFSEQILAYTMAGFGYSYFQHTNLSYAAPEIGVLFKQGNFGKINVRYTKYFSTNNYKYEDTTSLEQTFFLKENHDLVLSYKKLGSETEKSFRSLSIEYQYHF